MRNPGPAKNKTRAETGKKSNKSINKSQGKSVLQSRFELLLNNSIKNL